MSYPLHALMHLKTALRQRITALPAVQSLIGSSLYDVAPRPVTLPYMAFGDVQIDENDSDLSRAVIIDLELIFVLKERSTQHGAEILHALEAALRAPITLNEGYHLTSLEWKKTTLRHDANHMNARIVLKLRAFVEVNE